MSQRITIDDLLESLEGSSHIIQEFAKSSKADGDSKLLFDFLAQQHHYVLSCIIDYLKQQ